VDKLTYLIVEMHRRSLWQVLGVANVLFLALLEELNAATSSA
jgi:hypothetical protein